EIDLTIPAEQKEPPALFERVTSALEPLLDDVRPDELDESDEHQDLSFLAGETGFEQSLLARFALAHQLARTAIESEFWFALLGSSFFHYAETESLEQNFADLVEALPALDAAAVRKALAASFRRGDIP